MLSGFAFETAQSYMVMEKCHANLLDCMFSDGCEARSGCATIDHGHGQLLSFEGAVSKVQPF